MSLSTTQYGYIVDPMVPFTDDKGKTIKNGFIRVFMAGTSTPVLTYRNYDGATNQEKIELDNSGRVKHNVIGSKGSLYKVVVYNILHSQENPLLTVDKIAVLGASINATGATIVTGLDSVTVQKENFLKATVEGTGVELALDPTEVTSEVSTTAAAVTAAPDYVVPLLDKTGEGDSKKISLANLFKFALDWISRLATTITSFASGDFIAVSNPTDGTRKMSKDTLLTLTSQNALAGNVAQEFMPNSTNAVAGTPYVYAGNLYVAKEDYRGAWDSSKFERISISDGNIFTTPKSLGFPVIDWVDGKYVLISNGSIGNDASYATSDYIDVGLVDSILLKSFCSSQNSGICFYDADKVFISGSVIADANENTVSVPNGSKFARFTCNLAFKKTSYIRFENFIQNIARLDEKNIPYSIADFSTSKLSWVDGKYIDKSTGTLYDGASYSTTDYIYVFGDINLKANLSSAPSSGYVVYELDKSTIRSSGSLTSNYNSVITIGKPGYIRFTTLRRSKADAAATLLKINEAIGDSAQKVKDVSDSVGYFGGDFGWDDGKYIYTSGAIYSEAGYSISDYIDCYGLTSIILSVTCPSQNACMAIYDDNKNLVRTIATGTVSDSVIKISGRYIRLTSTTAGKKNAKLSFNVVREDIGKVQKALFLHINDKFKLSLGNSAENDYYGITYSNGKYSIPINYSKTYSLHFEFRIPKTVHSAIDPIEICDLPRYGASSNYGGFKIQLQPSAHSISAQQPSFPAGLRVAACSNGYSNNYSAVFNNTLVINKQFVGEDLFSVRFIGDASDVANQDIKYTIDNNGFHLYHDGGSTIGEVLFSGTDYVQFISDMETAVASGGDFEGILELDVIAYDGYTTDDIVRVAGIPLMTNYTTIGWDAFPSYVVSYDNEWHTIDARFNSDGSDAMKTITVAYDGVPLSWTDGSFSRGANSNADTKITIGASNVSVRNFSFDNSEAKLGCKKILLYVNHGLADGGNSEAPGSSLLIRYGRMKAIIDVHKANGFVPVKIEDVRDYLTIGKELPDKCYAVIHDDFFYFADTGSVTQKFRNLYDAENLVPNFAIIAQSGYLPPSEDDYKWKDDTCTFSLHETIDCAATSYSGLKSVLTDRKETLRHYVGDKNIFIYPYGSTSRNVVHLLKRLGFCLAASTNGVTPLPVGKARAITCLPRTYLISDNLSFNFNDFKRQIEELGSM